MAFPFSMITRVKPRKLFTALDFEKWKEGRKEGREGRKGKEEAGKEERRKSGLGLFRSDTDSPLDTQ